MIVLARRENSRRALDSVDPARVAMYDDARLAALLEDPGIVRNRIKMRAAVTNASAFLATREAHGSSAGDAAWVDGTPIVNPPGHSPTSASAPTCPTASART